ncbi:unnamed protein product%2C partial [Xyrichtys novacula]|uniref:Unnamed protein product, partial n=1 Tax=Xyrichtys novacula TaxID=13765 RepID=A0AAV1G5W4_XYRNO|nr:unnamed protein product%2C partial [Xyrichtys novacula]
MAPVCVACRLSLSALFLFVLFVSFVISKVSSLYVYDHQTLLDLRPSAKDLVKVDPDHCGHTTFKPFHPCGIPAHLRCTFAPFPRRKRRRRRGKRSGQQEKWSGIWSLSSSAIAAPCRLLAGTCRRIRWDGPSPRPLLSSSPPAWGESPPSTGPVSGSAIS